MGFLVCDKCGGYYELQEGESPSDFTDKCECGGKLKYIENLKDIRRDTEEKPEKSKPLFGRLKNWWDKQNKDIKVASIVGIFCVGVLITYGITGMSSADPGFQKYNGQYMSFQYPQGWYVDKEALGIVLLEDTPDISKSYHHFLAVRVHLTADNANEAMKWEFPSGNTIKTRNINGISYKYTDNYNNNTNVTNLYYYFFEKNGKYVYVTAGGVNGTSIAEKVILTFN